MKHAYIPDRFGKEKRKRRPGKEGKLGVEGMPPEVLEQALRRAGATILDQESPGPDRPALTKADLFAWGLSGGREPGKAPAAAGKSWTCPPIFPPTPCCRSSRPSMTGRPCWRNYKICDRHHTEQRKNHKMCGEKGFTKGQMWCRISP